MARAGIASLFGLPPYAPAPLRTKTMQSDLDKDSLRSVTIPDGTKLTFHPAVGAAERAVHDLLRKRPYTSDEARGIVRVEITRDVRDELRARVSTVNQYLVHGPRQAGPMQIMGISYYVVDTLPEPGWRVLP